MRRRTGAAAPFASLAMLVAACSSGTERTTPTRSGVASPSQLLTPTTEGAPTSGPSGSPAPAPAGTEIAFHSDPGGNDDTYLMRADGSHATALTLRQETVAQPVWSPDGSRLALACCASSPGRILLVNRDGSGLREVSGGVPGATSPAWSPDGGTLAFESTDRGAIFTVGVDSDSEPVRLVDGAGPSWSPDGESILVFRQRGGNLDVHTVDPETGAERRLTTEPGQDFSPAWSPDGSRIAYLSDRDGDEDVWVMDADGSNQVDVSQHADPDGGLTWSPDGGTLAYVEHTHGADPHSIGIGDAEVFVVRPDGSGRRNVTRSPAWEGDPAWSPNGSLIAFTRRTDHAEIFTIRPDGTGERFLRGTEGVANDCCAAWRPQP